jgi:hypothetical protein
MYKILILGSLILSACVSSNTVYLRQVYYNAQTNEIVQCGPFTVLDYREERTILASLSDCVEDYQRQGYERMPEPN